jgi:hypothetical protein
MLKGQTHAIAFEQRKQQINDERERKKARLHAQAVRRAWKMQQWRRAVKVARASRDKMKAALAAEQEAHRKTLDQLEVQKGITRDRERVIDQIRMFKAPPPSPPSTTEQEEPHATTDTNQNT